MSGYDQALTVMSVIGIGMMLVAMFLVRQFDKHQREAAEARQSKAHPAE
ncbi:MAG TPA: hypothetical protein VIJ94_04515 [Caulobacteraceae bacterium]